MPDIKFTPFDGTAGHMLDTIRAAKAFIPPATGDGAKATNLRLAELEALLMECRLDSEVSLSSPGFREVTSNLLAAAERAFNDLQAPVAAMRDFGKVPGVVKGDNEAPKPGGPNRPCQCAGCKAASSKRTIPDQADPALARYRARAVGLAGELVAKLAILDPDLSPAYARALTGYRADLEGAYSLEEIAALNSGFADRLGAL